MNIHYKSSSIASFYAQNRVQWDQFYPSEQYIFEKVFSQNKNIKTVLDVGCACGGLGAALNSRFGIAHYTGVDINRASIDIAHSSKFSNSLGTFFECADISAAPESLKGKEFDLVVSLGCADWNTDTRKIIQTCWEHTAIGGQFVFSFRLTNQNSLRSIDDGFQYVHFEEGTPLTGAEEKAPYVVTNIHEMFRMIDEFRPKPSRIMGYGYWGTPSAMAVIPYREIVFAVIAVRKEGPLAPNTVSELTLPLSLFLSNTEVAQV